MCCLQYPFPATEMQELEDKVLNDPIQKYPNEVSRDFVTLCNMMLKKDFSKRPDIEEVIYTDAFQTKSQKLGMTLPLALNKKKLQHQYSIGKLDIDITDKQRMLAGIGVKVIEKKVI